MTYRGRRGRVQLPRGRPVRAATLLVVALLAATGCSSPEQAISAPDPTSAASAPAATPSPARSDPPAARTPTPPIVATRSAPVTLSIPTIGVRSDLMRLGLEPDGSLEVPPGGFPAGWFTGAPTPGELGPAVIAGHVHWVDGRGVFWELGKLRQGDRVSVSRRDGSTARFRVTRTASFSKAAFPTERVYGDIEHAGLRLITCGGYDKESQSYEANVVVFAELVAVVHS